MAELRKSKGMRERSPGVWELFADAGRDPVTGKRRRISRTFRGNLRDAKKARAKLITEISNGVGAGTQATVEYLCTEWLKELKRKGRSPSTIYNYQKTYRHDIAATLGHIQVAKVTTKMLTDLYGEHQDRGLSPGSVYQVHATMSSMMTQACRWGWRDSNPAQWAEPPPRENKAPVVPTPDEIRRLLDGARSGKRPEYARVILIAATTAIRRGEICALRCRRNLDLNDLTLLISNNMIGLNGQPLQEWKTKNRRSRTLAIDGYTLDIVKKQIGFMKVRAEAAGVELVDDFYLFSDSVDGSAPWRPGRITLYFKRLAVREELDHLTFKSLRKFMETYGQELGFSLAQVAIRAGHDPAVAAKHYTGRLSESDRALAEAVADLLDDKPLDPTNGG